MTIDQFQFYPTPLSLAKRAWKKFKNRNFVRVLEPHAGNGDLAMAAPFYDDYHGWRSGVKIDCCEIDMSRHATLRGKALNVVGMDFLEFSSASLYSHIVMNPPFAQGCKHVLKAFDALWNGEVVAIIGAETLRNPYSKERQHLVKLIEKYGDVEYLSEEFMTDETQRKTSVEIALVRLEKKADVQADIVGDIVSKLTPDAANEKNMHSGYEQQHELAIPNSTIENWVLTFDMAVKVMKEAAMAQAKANHYEKMLGKTMVETQSTPKEQLEAVQFVHENVYNKYVSLKDRAWTGVLSSTNVTSRLSSKAQGRVHSEFEQIKKMEFTSANIHGFLLGLCESQGQIQMEMVEDIFDQFSRYHGENSVFYRGWKSNSKHRTCGMKLKSTRFVMPRCGMGDNYLDHDTATMLRDLDRVFAMMDGKSEAEISLESIFHNQLRELKNGERLYGSYFSVRYYPGKKTIHFFPSDKALVDRLNRIVGARRQWLPPSDTPINKGFEHQYENAEKFDKELHQELNKMAGHAWHNNPLTSLSRHHSEERDVAMEKIDTAMSNVLAKRGIDVDFRIESNWQQQQLLAA